MNGKVALLVVDMSNDFCDRDYEIANGVFVKPGLPVPNAQCIIKPIKDLLEVARENDVFIAYIMDRHEKDDPEFKEWSPHCVKSFAGSKVIDELYTEGVRTYGKQVYNGFINPYLARDLKSAKVSTVIIVGLVGDVCVKATALGAKENGFEVIFVLAATAFLPDAYSKLGLIPEKVEELREIGQLATKEEAEKILKGLP